MLSTLSNLLRDLPPLSLSNSKGIAGLGKSCIDEGRDFLYSVLSADSSVDKESRRVALDILFLFALQEGKQVYSVLVLESE